MIDVQEWTSVKVVAIILGVVVSLWVAQSVAERAYNFQRQINGSRPDNTISVAGTGKVKAVPDVAVVSLGVMAQGKDAKETQNQAVEKINKITAFVKSLGVVKEDITTSQASLNPRYDYNPNTGQNRPSGFESRQTVSVKVRGVDKNSDVVGKIMAGAIDNGANEVYNSQFMVDDPENLKQEARKLAIQKAKEKAVDLAQAAGISLGRVISVNASDGGFPVPMPYYADKGLGTGSGGGGEMMSFPPNIEPGSQEIIQTVMLVFQVR